MDVARSWTGWRVRSEVLPLTWAQNIVNEADLRAAVERYAGDAENPAPAVALNGWILC